MTNEYIQGFCKTAEAYGVNPHMLIKIAARIPSLKGLRGGFLGLEKITPARTPRYILGQAPRGSFGSSLYRGYAKRKVPIEYRVALLDQLLRARNRRLWQVSRALDRTPLSQAQRGQFLDAIEASKGSAAGPMLDNIRTSLFNNGRYIPEGSLKDIQRLIERDMGPLAYSDEAYRMLSLPADDIISSPALNPLGPASV